MLIERDLQKVIEKWLFQGKILILYGARQVGKTTLVKNLKKKYPQDAVYFDCEAIEVKQALEISDPMRLKHFIGSPRLVIFDEAQKVANIGLALKLLIDHYPTLQIIATGSSSFDLANKVNEPLTGRALEFTLLPFSLGELRQQFLLGELDQQLERFLRFGLYPEISQKDEPAARVLLDNLTAKYLYKDVLEFDRVRRSEMLLRLLQLLALQIGNEVSYYELAQNLGVDRNTVVRYLDLLEKAFVIFKLRAFSRNLRKEINKKNKIYFYDLGVRNSLIANFNPLSLRSDVGPLWENFCLVERLKSHQAQGLVCHRYFWRTHDQKEIDYLEESEGKLRGFEFKWQKKDVIQPREFLATYPGSSVSLVNRENYQAFLNLT